MKGKGGRVATGHSRVSVRWASLLAGMFVAFAGGGIYSFAIWSDALKKHFGWSQTHLDRLAIGGNIGMLLAVGGVFYDRLGPRFTTAVGILLSFLGYTLVWAGRMGHAPADVTSMAVYCFLWGQGSAWLDTASVVSVAVNFKADRGKAVGIMKSFAGGAPAILTMVYDVVLGQNAEHFVLFMGTVLPLGCAAAVYWLTEEHRPGDDTTPVKPVSAPGPAAPGWGRRLLRRLDSSNRLRFQFLFAVIFLVYGLAVAGDIFRVVAPQLMTKTNKAWLLAVVSLLFVPLVLLARPERAATAAAASLGERQPLLGSPPLFARTRDVGAGETGHWRLVDVDSEAGHSPPPLPTSPATAPLEPDFYGAAVAAVAAERPGYHPFQVLVRSEFWALALVVSMTAGAGLMVINNCAQIAESYGAPAHLAHVFVSLFTIGSASGRMLSGMLSDRFAHRLSRPGFLCLAVGSLLALLVAISAVGSYPPLFAACLVIGMCYGSNWVLAPTIALELWGERYFGSIYMLICASPIPCTFLFSNLIAARFYEAQIRRQGLPDSNVCLGPECFRSAFLVVAGLLLLALALNVWLTRRTASVYRAAAARLRSQSLADAGLRSVSSGSYHGI